MNSDDASKIRDAGTKSTLAYGTTILVLGNIFQLLKAFDETSEMATKVLGNFGVDTLQAGTIVLIVAGIAVLFQTIRKQRDYWRRKSIIVAGTSVTVLSIVNIMWVELRVPEPVLEQKIKGWCKEIQETQKGSLGFPISTKIPEVQVWTDAQLLKALLLNARRDMNLIDSTKIRAVFAWIEQVRRPDGWTYFTNCAPNEPTITEIASWVVVAQAESIQVPGLWSEPDAKRIREQIERDLHVIMSRQQADGGFSPISSNNVEDCRTYSTAMAVWAMLETRKAFPDLAQDKRLRDGILQGVRWLASTYKKDIKSWVPKPQRPNQKERFLGLSAQVLYILSTATKDDFVASSYEVLEEASISFIHDNELKTLRPGASQRMHDADQHVHSAAFESCFQLEGSTFLAYPWAVLALNQIEHLPKLPDNERRQAVHQRGLFLSPDIVTKATVYMTEELFYVWAEYITAFGVVVKERDLSSWDILTTNAPYKLGIFVAGVGFGCGLYGFSTRRRPL